MSMLEKYMIINYKNNTNPRKINKTRKQLAIDLHFIFHKRYKSETYLTHKKLLSTYSNGEYNKQPICIISQKIVALICF